MCESPVSLGLLISETEAGNDEKIAVWSEIESNSEMWKAGLLGFI
jgi:hypothetical protein